MSRVFETITTTGFGFDSHAFGREGSLVLGGLQFKEAPQLVGHSDGDALLHAVIDALLGASSLGDIGELFPDTAKKYKGISSRTLLATALRKIKKANFDVIHVDVTVLANTPRLSKSKLKIAKALSVALGNPVGGVNIKAKTQEGLNWFGVDGGIAVWAVASLAKTLPK